MPAPKEVLDQIAVEVAQVRKIALEEGAGTAFVQTEALLPALAAVSAARVRCEAVHAARAERIAADKAAAAEVKAAEDKAKAEADAQITTLANAVAEKLNKK